MTSPDVGKTVRVQAACGPAYDSSSARDAESARKMRPERALVAGGGGKPLPSLQIIFMYLFCVCGSFSVL